MHRTKIRKPFQSHPTVDLASLEKAESQRAEGRDGEAEVFGSEREKRRGRLQRRQTALTAKVRGADRPTGEARRHEQDRWRDGEWGRGGEKKWRQE